MTAYRTALALQDIWEISEWLIERVDAELALGFVDGVESSIHFLETSPKTGTLFRIQDMRLEGLRYWLVEGFPNHLIFYRAEERGLVIYRVLHGARDLENIL